MTKSDPFIILVMQNGMVASLSQEDEDEESDSSSDGASGVDSDAENVSPVKKKGKPRLEKVPYTYDYIGSE